MLLLLLLLLLQQQLLLLLMMMIGLMFVDAMTNARLHAADTMQLDADVYLRSGYGFVVEPVKKMSAGQGNPPSYAEAHQCANNNKPIDLPSFTTPLSKQSSL
jgi:hypothetical protein